MNGEFLGYSNDIVILEEIMQTGKEKDKGQEHNRRVGYTLTFGGFEIFRNSRGTQEGRRESSLYRQPRGTVVACSMYPFVSFEL